MLRTATLLLALLTAAPAAAQAPALKPGTTKLANDAFVYLPSNLGDAPAPLIVILRGALGSGEEFLARMIVVADRRGAVMLAPEPAGQSWRLKVTSDDAAELGPDADRVDAAIAEVAKRARIDRKHVILLGFSDGASYGLSYGLASPDVFHAVLAMAPGYAVLAPKNDPTQLVFVSHGRRDSILPFTNTRDSIVPSLEASGLKPKVHWFDGDHTIDRAALEEGLDYALGVKPARVEVGASPR